MLQIVLLILKIVGIILLVLLGIFLALLLCLLFIPLRYKGQGSYYKQPEGSLKITWLLHILSVAVIYKEQLEITVKLLGFRILKDFDEEPFEEAEEAAKEAVRTTGKIIADEPMVSAQEIKEPLKPMNTEAILAKGEKREAGIPETQKKKEAAGTGTSEETHEKTADFTGEKGLLRLIGRKCKSFFHYIFTGIKNIFKHFDRIRDARQNIMAFIEDEENRKTFNLILRQGRRILRHLLPGKLKGHISFGISDPYIMGQVLSGAAFFYPLYQKQFTLIPVFDRQFIEGEAAFKGHIRLSVFLMAGLRILLNKNFRTQLKKFRSRGGM